MPLEIQHFADSGASKFIVQINRFCNKALVRMQGGPRAAITEMVRRVLDRSPVSPVDSGHSGRFKGNWLITLDAPSNVYDKELRDPDGSTTFALAVDALEGIDFGGDFSVWFSNHAPYAVRLEYGWSDQAPAGMVRITAAEWSSIVREVFIKGGGGADTGDDF